LADGLCAVLSACRMYCYYVYWLDKGSPPLR